MMKTRTIALVLLSAPALGASFDCTKATAPREKLICSDRTLSDRDTEMAETFKTAQAKLSDTGRQALLSEQRAWLRYMKQACPIVGTPTGEKRENAQYCLDRVYSDRIQILEQTGQQVGPFVFRIVAHYFVHRPERPNKDDARGSDSKNISTGEMAYPQIDSPLTAITQRWNAMNAIQGGPDSYCEEGGPSDDYLIGKIVFASAHLITVEKFTDSYCHGAAHGMGGRRSETLVLEPEPHRLTPADLFRPDQPWKARLTALVAAGVRKAYVEERKAEPTNLNQKAIADAAASLDRWQITTAGFAVTFETYELGQGYAFNPTVTIPWSDLKDVMVAGAPVP